MKRYLFIFFALVLVFSCKKEGTGSADHNGDKGSFPITGDSDAVGKTSARLYGGSYGTYWLSALDAGNSSLACRGLILETDIIDEGTLRCFGCSVRPVMN